MPGPSDIKDIHGPAQSEAGHVHFNQLLRVRRLAQEKEHPFLAPVECYGLSLPDDDRIFLNGFDHLI
jgi:hypothetical protein